MRINVVRTTEHPVVKLYIDTIQEACTKAGYVCPNVRSKEKKLNKADYLITDSPLVSARYILRGFKNHIVWFQGVAPEESFMVHHSPFRYAVLSFVEKLVLWRAKLLFFVSEPMKTHYEKKYGLDLSSKGIVMPCFNETGITETAFSQEKYKHNTFVYVGGLQPWQCFEETVKLYAEIERRSTVPTKFCVFTYQKTEAEQLLRKHGIQNFSVDCVDKDELSDRIKGMKYGFVLREDCTVNNVATPTKFSNYLANGIIPIYSPVLKSFAEFDQNVSIGIPCRIDNLKAGAEAVLKDMQREVQCDEIKRKCEYAFATYYNQDRYVERISSRLIELLSNQ